MLLKWSTFDVGGFLSGIRSLQGVYSYKHDLHIVLEDNVSAAAYISLTDLVTVQQFGIAS